MKTKQITFRMLGIGFGFGNQLLFLATVWYLFWFLRDGSLGATEGSWLMRDCLLALMFAAAHSVMLYPPTRKRLSRWIPQAFYDSVFCVVTCITLLVLFFAWRTSPTVLWRFGPNATVGVQVAFVGCWGALVYSLALTGLGHQNGWTPFYHWLRRQTPPRRQFRPSGAYRLIRHPVYLSFLGLVWFTPRMTLDHAALTAIWTGYIFYGSFLKDRRLMRFIGTPYREYMRRVPGWPGLQLVRRLMATGMTSTERSAVVSPLSSDETGGSKRRGSASGVSTCEALQQSVT